jgi:hypothetical protein
VGLNGPFENTQAVETTGATNQNYIHVNGIVTPELMKHHAMKTW